MEFSILEVEKNPIIREQFLQKTNDSAFCKKYGNLIHNIMWLEYEFNLNMLHLFDSTFIQIEHLLQCPKVIKYLLEKNNGIYFLLNNNLKNLKPDKSTIEYIITKYPKKCDSSFLHYVYLFYQDLVITFFKMHGNKLDDIFVKYQINHIFHIEYMDYFLIIEKYIPKEQFEKNLKICMATIFRKLSMEMLDYILLNYNILTPQITLSLIHLYDYSDDIMNRCQMYGQFDINCYFKYSIHNVNFVKMLYYIFTILGKCKLLLFLPNFNQDNFDKEKYAAILEAIHYCINYRINIEFCTDIKIQKVYHHFNILHKNDDTYNPFALPLKDCPFAFDLCKKSLKSKHAFTLCTGYLKYLTYTEKNDIELDYVYAFANNDKN